MVSRVTELLSAYSAAEKRPQDVLDETYASIEASGERPIWISTFSREEAARQLAAADPAGPLYGVPFAVKDNIDVAGLPTTAACAEFARRPTRHATVVERLVKAGAIVIGKTNLDQFATGLVGTRTPYGICSSIFDPKYISGGSSSGSAVAVAKGQVAFSLGTDTAGSGRVPAAFNALVGVKPTRGLLSTRGVVPACRSLDCVSIFAHSVADGELLLDVCAGFDAEDSFSRGALALNGFGDGQVRLGVPLPEQLEFFGDRESEAAFASALERASALGFEIVRFDFEPFSAAAKLLYVGPWVAERYAGISEFIEAHESAMDAVVRDIVLGARKYDAASAFRGMYRLAELRRLAERTFETCDALLLPTAPSTYTIEDVLANPVELNSRLGTYTNFVNLLDLSALAVPAGFKASGLPFGVTFMAPAFHDARLLELGHAFVDGARRDAKPAPGCVRLAVAGAHLSGQPLNHELVLRGARRIMTTRTAPEYQLFALDTTPAKPGLVYAPGEVGHAIEVEIWELTREAFGSFVAAIPAPMTIGMTKLSDGTWLKGFGCEPHALRGAKDISDHGSWRAYRTSLAIG